MTLTRSERLLDAFRSAARNYVTSQVSFYRDDMNELAGELINKHGFDPDFLNDTYNNIEQAWS